MILPLTWQVVLPSWLEVLRELPLILPLTWQVVLPSWLAVLPRWLEVPLALVSISLVALLALVSMSLVVLLKAASTWPWAPLVLSSTLEGRRSKLA